MGSTEGWNPKSQDRSESCRIETQVYDVDSVKNGCYVYKQFVATGDADQQMLTDIAAGEYEMVHQGGTEQQALRSYRFDFQLPRVGPNRSQ